MSDKPLLSRKKINPGGQVLKAILFDLDGVLWESSTIHHQALLEVLRPWGIRRLDYAQVAGMKTEEALRRIFRRARQNPPPEVLAQLVRKKQALAQKYLSARPPLRPHCRTMLQKLNRHFKLALVSSSNRRSVNLFLKASSSRCYFSVVLSGDHVRNAKPDPAIYCEALRRLKVGSHEALVVEDAVPGILAARRAGLRTIAMTGTTDPKALRRVGAEHIFATLISLTDYVKRLQHR